MSKRVKPGGQRDEQGYNERRIALGSEGVKESECISTKGSSLPDANKLHSICDQVSLIMA